MSKTRHPILSSGEEFSCIDFFFVKEREGKKKVFSIQVTFSKTHPRPRSAYEEFYKCLGLDPNTDEVTIYFISSSSKAEGYTSVSTTVQCQS